MSINFPDFPTLNQVFTDPAMNRSWRWDGEKWLSFGDTGPTGPTGSTGPTGPAGPAGDTPPGVVSQYAGVNPPSGWLMCNGSDQSRSTYSALFNTFGTTFTNATTTNGSTTVSGLTGMVSATHVGWGIAGTNIPGGSTIVSVGVGGTSVVISSAALGASSTATIAISPYGFATGSSGNNNTTTFKLPNLAGRVPVGIDGTTEFTNLGKASGDRSVILTGAQSGTSIHSHPNTLSGASGASTTHTHSAGSEMKVPIGAVDNNSSAIAYEATDPSPFGPSTVTSYTVTGTVLSNTVARTYNHHTRVYGNTTAPSSTHTTSITNANSTAASATEAHTNLQPYIVLNYIIKT